MARSFSTAASWPRALPNSMEPSGTKSPLAVVESARSPNVIVSAALPADCSRIVREVVDRKIPTPALPALSAEAERALAPCGPQMGAQIARILVGSYPSRQVHDPAMFARAIASIFAEFPHEIGKRAVDALTRRSKFLPTRAEVLEACREAAEPINILIRCIHERLTHAAKNRLYRMGGRADEFARDYLCGPHLADFEVECVLAEADGRTPPDPARFFMGLR